MAFAKAKTLNTAKVAKGKVVTDHIELDGLRDYVLIDSLIKNLTTLKNTAAGEVKDFARDRFVDEAEEKGKIENFKAFDGEGDERATASIQCRKRSSASALSDEERADFDAEDIPYDTVENVVETFAINPDYLADEKMLSKAEKALAKAGLPEDFIVHQQSVKKYVVTDETKDAVIKKGLVERFFDSVFTLAIRGKLDKDDTGLKRLLTTLNEVLGNETDKEGEKA